MSVHAKRNAALIALSGVSALILGNYYITPSNSKHRGMVYNSVVHPEQDRRDTIMDRKNLMDQDKKRKPWNMTAAERQRAG